MERLKAGLSTPGSASTGVSKSPMHGDVKLGKTSDHRGSINSLKPSMSASRGSFSQLVQMPGVQASFNTSGKGGAAFRPISENFEVNAANGTLSLSVPIHTSPSRSGYDMNLTVSYDSGNGNGPFGFGWALSLPAITRRTADGIPRYNEDNPEDTVDTFMLSGTDELVLVDTLINENFTVHRYRPRVDTSYLRIERWVKKDDAQDVHWRTISPANVTSIFGDTDTSRIVDGSLNRKRIFSWQVSYTYDSFGNAVQYHYKGEDGAGVAGPDCPCWEDNRSQVDRSRQKYIKSITYGNKIPNRRLDSWELSEPPTEWMFRVVFDYGDHEGSMPSVLPSTDWSIRRDAFSFRNAGFEIRTYRLCRRILMFHHFPEELGRQDTLVASTDLQYEETCRATFLTSIVSNGFSTKHGLLNTGDESICTSLPPWTFEYSGIPDPASLEIKKTSTSPMYALPTLSEVHAEWIDMDGEGIPGLFVQLGNGTMAYQRNFSSVSTNDNEITVHPMSVLPSQPNLRSAGANYLDDLDRSGRKCWVAIGTGGEPHGFFGRTELKAWDDFCEFSSNAGTNMLSPDLVRIDLTGDGLLDILHVPIDSGTLEWQQSLARSGFSQKLISRPLCGPINVQSESTDNTRTYFADMTGDGLSDIVNVSNGCISYWPNLGYAMFGDEVRMANSPVLAQGDQFTHSRLRLLDLDGSGTTDIIYMLPGGKVVIFYNFAGNQWSDGITISNLPEFDKLSTFSVVDLFGTGTGCLCWTTLETNTSGPGTIYYLDLMTFGKPHILTAFQNGMGTKTSICYRPSTEFYLEDEHSSSPWETRLPFPVQCVSSTLVTDTVTQHAKATSYTYHDGYYCGITREFRGFGMVEQNQTEAIPTGKGTLELPGLYTKTWYGTGASLAIASAKRAFSESEVTSQFSQSISATSWTEATRAMRGMVMRQELYCEDGSAISHLPYKIAEFSYNIEQLIPSTNSHKGVFTILPSETLTYLYERNVEDPRCEHIIVLGTNEYGEVTHEVDISYGRSITGQPISAGESYEEQQVETRLVYSRTLYTNAVNQEDVYLKPLAWSSRQYETRYSDITNRFDIKRLLELGIGRSIDDQVLPPPNSSLIAANRLYFRSSDMSSRLPGGRIEQWSVQDQAYQLCIVAGDNNHALIEACTSAVGQGLEDFMKENGYRDLDSDSQWWVPSSQLLFSTSEDHAVHLGAARNSFYVPTIMKDPFGKISNIDLDTYKLLAVGSTDNVGNRTAFEIDYWHLCPWRIVDANNNVQEAIFDGFGKVLSVAIQGKPGRNQGESIDGFVDVDPGETIDQVMRDPVGPLTLSLLGTATQRTLIDLTHRIASAAEAVSVPRPPTILTISRLNSDRTGTTPDIGIEITFLDSSGFALQQLSLVDTDGTDCKWRVSEAVVTDFSKNVLRAFQPFHSSSGQYVDPSEIKSASTTYLLDSLGRSIGQVTSDGRFSKVQVKPWSVTHFTFGDNVLLNDPVSDPDVGLIIKRWGKGLIPTTWHKAQTMQPGAQNDAAVASEIYHNTPQVSYLDASGREVALQDVCGTHPSPQETFYDAGGRIFKHQDQLQRVVELRSFDLLGRCTKSQSIDGGTVITLHNCMGNLVLSSPSADIWTRTVYDDDQREVELWMKKRDAAWKLTTRSEYGENNQRPEDNNLRGQLWRTHDHSGISCNVNFDARGNCTETTAQFAVSYSAILDWNEENELLPDVHYEQHAFNYSGQRTSSRDAAGNQTDYTYDKIGDLQTVQHRRQSDPSQPSSSNVSESQMYVKSTTYSADNLPLEIHYGNDTVVSTKYDDYSRQKVRETVRRSGDVVDEKEYQYDCEDRLIYRARLSDERVFFRNCIVLPESSFRYDALGQLISATGREQLTSSVSGSSVLEPPGPFNGINTSSSLGDGSQMCQYLETYEYDVVGNILKVKHMPTEDHSVSGWTRTFFYEETSQVDASTSCNRLSRTTVADKTEAYKYEGRAGEMGCMTSIPGFSALKYNCYGVLAASATTNVNDGTPETTYYVYNSEGARVRKVTERAISSSDRAFPRKLKETIYVGDLEIHTVFKGDGFTVASQVQTSVISGVSKVVTIEKNVLTAHSLVRYCYDSSIELDDQGQLISYEEYSPYGSCTYSARRSDVEAPRTYRFASYIRDSETGLFFCEERYYAGWLARWTSPDPMGSVDGPNHYSYCRNDPVNYVDPEGSNAIYGSAAMNASKKRATSVVVNKARKLTIAANQDIPVTKPEKKPEKKSETKSETKPETKLGTLQGTLQGTKKGTQQGTQSAPQKSKVYLKPLSPSAQVKRALTVAAASFQSMMTQIDRLSDATATLQKTLRHLQKPEFAPHPEDHDEGFVNSQWKKDASTVQRVLVWGAAVKPDTHPQDVHTRDELAAYVQHVETYTERMMMISEVAPSLAKGPIGRPTNAEVRKILSGPAEEFRQESKNLRGSLSKFIDDHNRYDNLGKAYKFW